jgi:hypothetical protein
MNTEKWCCHCDHVTGMNIFYERNIKTLNYESYCQDCHNHENWQSI